MRNALASAGRRRAASAALAAGITFSVLAPAAPAAAKVPAGASIVPVYQSSRVDGGDYLPTRDRNEAAGTYTDPYVAFEAWDIAPNTAIPAGLRPVYRGYNAPTGRHFLTTDANGAGRGVVEATIGYLAVNTTTAAKYSRYGCDPVGGIFRGHGPSTVTEVDVYGRAPAPVRPFIRDAQGHQVPAPVIKRVPGPYLTRSSRAGDNRWFIVRPREQELEVLGYGPCNKQPNLRLESRVGVGPSGDARR